MALSEKDLDLIIEIVRSELIKHTEYLINRKNPEKEKQEREKDYLKRRDLRKIRPSYAWNVLPLFKSYYPEDE